MSKIYIVIVTYNGMQWLTKSLATIKQYPTIIVDNKSIDGTVNFIQCNYPEFTLLQQPLNLGFGQANNIGISHALQQGADYVFLMNQDAYLQNNCIETLISQQLSYPDYGVLSPIHLNGSGEKLDKNFETYLFYYSNSEIYSDLILKRDIKEIYETSFVNAAGWLISKNCLENIGGFDPIFFHYGEDDNYCQRMKYHNFKIGIVPNAFFKHDRENRVEKIDIGENYFKNYERTTKLKYADINLEETKEISTTIKKRKLMALKSFLKLRLASGKFYRKEASLLEKILPEIKKSRTINKTKGSHYLKI